MMNRIFQNSRKAKKWTLVLAALVAIVACSATAFSDRAGNVTNDDHKDDKYNNPISISKIVSEETEYQDYKLTLSAEGYDRTVQTSQDVYAVFVIDATRSIGTNDVPSGDGGANVTRFKTARDSAKAYINAFFEEESAAGRGQRYAAVVSFGNSARIHLDESRAKAFGSMINKKAAAKDDGQDAASGVDYFIGRTSSSEDATGLQSAKAGFQDAENYFAAFKSRFDADGDVTDDFFYRDTEQLASIVDNLSAYSNTNIESGLLAADYIIRHLPRDAKKYVFLITDGEASVSSWYAEAFNRFSDDTVIGALLKDDNGDKLSSGGAIDAPYLLAKVFARVAEKASDEAFVSSITGFSHTDVNFFAGRGARLRDSGGFGGHSTALTPTLAKAAQDYIVAADSVTSRSALRRDEFYAYLDEIDRRNNLSSIASFDSKVKDNFVPQLFWVARERPPYFPDKDAYDFYKEFGEMRLTMGQGILPDYSVLNDGNLLYDMRFDAVFSDNAKHQDTLEIDYNDSEPYNFTGSDAAKRHMNAAADILKDKATVYAVGIGSLVVMPEKLAEAASSGETFMLCRDGGDPYLTAQQ
jgi:hypothetical protein